MTTQAEPRELETRTMQQPTRYAVRSTRRPDPGPSRRRRPGWRTWLAGLALLAAGLLPVACAGGDASEPRSSGSDSAADTSIWSDRRPPRAAAPSADDDANAADDASAIAPGRLAPERSAAAEVAPVRGSAPAADRPGADPVEPRREPGAIDRVSDRQRSSPADEAVALGSAPRLADASGASRDDGRSVVAPDRERSRYPRPDRPAFEPPDAMFFHDWGVNPWQDSWRDSRSTFALDVDTGSYGLVRSYLEQGLMPPPAAVRVEEMVNAIDQGYRQPWAEDFALRIDGARDPFGADANEVLLRVGIQARAVSQRQRLPARLSFVIDVSGSMGGDNRLELVKDALATLVEGLGPDDAVAIVAYSDEAWVVLPMTPADQPHRILRALEALQPQASTNAEAGIALGYDLAAEAFEPEAINRVVLCSDGVANVGARGPRAILQRIERELARGITLTAVGVGMGNYNDALMEQLADHGEGSYHYVDDRREARRIFGENLTATLQLVARDAKVQVEFNPKTVWAYRLIGYENRDLADRDFEDDRVDAGEIGAGQSATALYALSLVPDARGELATVQLRWARADSGEVRSLEAHARASDLAERWDHADAAFRLTGALATFAEILRESPYAEGLSLDAVIGIADAAARDLGSDEAYAVADLMALAGEPRRAGFESRRSHGYPERAPESGRSGTGAGRAGTDRSTGLDKCVAICILVFRCSNSYASSVDGELR